jgi:hypothetical protein
VLLAARINPNAEKTVLVYWQADGHSVDPAAWKWPNAFEPILKEEISTGHRGKIPWDSLDKGLDQGSPNLPDAVNCNRDLLAADMLLIFDGSPHASNKPTVVVGARGIMTVQLVTYGPITPQHSGHYGNYAPNPALRMAQILGSMKSDAGRVLLVGFYDGVILDTETRNRLTRVPDDAPAIKRRMGIAETDEVGAGSQPGKNSANSASCSLALRRGPKRETTWAAAMLAN